MSHRAQQLGSVLQRAVQSVIERGFSDPRIQGVITVTNVRVSPDLKHATIGVTVMPEEHEKLTLHGLKSAARFVRRQAGELVALHRLPEFEFRIDERVKREANVLSAISEAMATLDRSSASDARADVSTDDETLPDEETT